MWRRTVKETSQQYIARILGNLNDEDPISVLRAMPQRITRLLKGRTRKQLYTRPEPHRWSVAEIVAHLAETELVLGWRYRSIVERSGVPLQSFEQDDWAVNSRYATSDVKQMLLLFAILRSANLRFLNGLSPKQWKHYGMHQQRGKESVEHIVRLEAGHDLNHLRQIQRILKPKG